MKYFALLSCLVLIVAGCGADDGGTSSPADSGVADATATDAGPAFNGIDVLFVVNNSYGTSQLQDKLADNVYGLFSALSTALGALPETRVGVISTDMGDGDFGANGCFGTGHNGALLGDSCGGGAFATGSDATSLAENVACRVKLGDFGCGFEQPLASIERALDPVNGPNPDFIRDDALLVVIVLTDEDDCSATDPELYTPVASVLGRWGAIRCFNWGVQCSDGPIENTGPRTGCMGAASDYMKSPRAYADVLEGLKGPGRVVFGGVMPPAGPVEVVQKSNLSSPRLKNVCGGQLVQSTPSIRLHDVAAALGGTETIQSVCDDDWLPGMRSLAERVAAVYDTQR